MDGLYDLDILEWSEHQARLLREHAAGARSKEAPDWTNIIEEIESVGREQLHTVESLLMRMLAKQLKAKAWPDASKASSWLAEARGFGDDAAARFVPSMRHRIDLAKVYRRALTLVPDVLDGQKPLPLPQLGPATIDELLAEVSDGQQAF